MRILIIDDNSTDLRLLATLVGHLDHCEPVCFRDPEPALTWLDQESAELILIDERVPRTGGLELLRSIRSRWSRLPVVLVCDDQATAARKAAAKLGVSEFVTKPIEPAVFLLRLGNLLEQSRNQRLLADRSLQLASEVRVATREYRERELELMTRLCRAAEFRDTETGAHGLRMAHYVRLIAEAIGNSPAKCDDLFSAAPIHDIGKIAIPDLILLKPGRLADDEREIMRTHSQVGFDLLNNSRSQLLQLGAEIALSHHEKWDGSGYPNHLAGHQIPQCGRIVAVADVFDALVTPRPYKQSWTLDQAGHYLRENRGRHFDPDCVDGFLSCWPEIVAIHHHYAELVH